MATSTIAPPPPPPGVTFVDGPPPPPSGIKFAEDHQTPSDENWLGHVANAVSNWWQQVNPVKQAQGLAQAVAHPINTIAAYGQQNAKIAAEAEDEFKKGNYASGTAHVVNYLLNGLPGVGGTLDVAQKQAESGDVSGALGTTAGLATNLYVGAKAPELAEKAADIAGKVTSKIGKGVAAIEGKMTGAGAKPLEQAATAPTPGLIEQMRSPDEMRVLGDMKDALENVKQSRAANYSAQLEKISSPDQPPIDPTPILAKLDSQLEQFRVGKVPEPPPRMTGPEYMQWRTKYAGQTPGELDFSASPIGKSGQVDIQHVHDLVSNWPDWSPAGADALKRRIADLYSDSGQARALITSVKNEVKQGIVDQVPEYATMTKDYENASRFLDSLKDLSIDAKNPGTAIRKITTTLNQNNEYRNMLVEALNQYSEKDLKGEIAGLALSKLAPRGIMGPASGAGLLYGIMTGSLSPHAVAAAALTSPRLMGEVAVAMGQARPFISALSEPGAHFLGAAEQGLAAGGATAGTIPALPVAVAEQQQPSQQQARIGSTVTLKDGTKGIVKSMSPDGKIEVVPE